MTVLLDANVLIALVVAERVHHDAAEAWFSESGDGFATCPITEGSLLRLLIREGYTAGAAKDVVQELSAHERHEFWPDSVSYADVAVRFAVRWSSDVVGIPRSVSKTPATTHSARPPVVDANGMSRQRRSTSWAAIAAWRVSSPWRGRGSVYSTSR